MSCRSPAFFVDTICQLHGWSDQWIGLVSRVRWSFPGLEAQEKLNEHKDTVLKFMGKRQAICVKEENEIAGVMLFSRGHKMICCLAVALEYRRRGVASMLMDEALGYPNQVCVLHPSDQ